MKTIGGEGQKPVPIAKVEEIVGKQVIFYNVDLLDYNSVSQIFDKVCYYYYYIL